MAFGSFYKGEKKKAKKGEQRKPNENQLYAPPAVEIISKGKNKYK